MKFRIITIEREYGCGAPVIAQQLATHLGWKLWDQALTAEIARIAKVAHNTAKRCDERVDPFLHRLAKSFWRASYERALQLPEPETFDSDYMVSLMRRVVEGVANQGSCVIVGRGSPYFLRERTDVFHVFLYAPREEKIRRLMRHGRGRADAEELVSVVDQERAAFIRHYFGQEWPNRYLYHVMINTLAGNQSVIDTVLNTMQTVGAPVAAGDTA